MINLLPEQNKHDIKKTIRLRWYIIVMVFLSIIFAVFTILMVPSYLFVSTRYSIAESQINSVNKSEGFAIDQTMKVVVDDLSKKIAVFPENPSSASSTIKSIFSSISQVKTPGIYINNFIFTKNTPDNVATIKLTGKSESRNTLYQFSQKLEEMPNFSGVTIPVSSFIKGKNTDFVISFKYTQ